MGLPEAWGPDMLAVGLSRHVSSIRRRSRQLVLAGVVAVVTFGLAAYGEQAAMPAATAEPTDAATVAAAALAPPSAELIEQGRSVADANGCLTCHSTDGSTLVGPSWQGLFGSEKALADGSSVTVDDDYIRMSILDPDAQIAPGFDSGLMPKTFADTLSDDDIDAIIGFIRSL